MSFDADSALAKQLGFDHHRISTGAAVTERAHHAPASNSERNLITTQPPPDSYGPQLLATLQDAFRSVWATLYPHIGTDDEQGKELSTRLTQALMTLVAAGLPIQRSCEERDWKRWRSIRASASHLGSRFECSRGAGGSRRPSN